MSEMKKFVPSDHQVSFLAKLGEPLLLHRPTERVGGFSTLMLSVAGVPSLRLRVCDHTVAFKFEVFELRVEPWEPQEKFELTKMTQIAGWNTIQCLFRFEWLRPAAIGEVPAQYEKVVGDRGPRKVIPVTASSLAVSMVGIAFSKDQLPPTMAITNSDDDPVTLCVSDNAGDVYEAIRDCERVNLDEVPRWISSL